MSSRPRIPHVATHSGNNSSSIEYEMLHIIMTRDGMAGIDGRRLDAIKADIKRYLRPDLSEAEHQLIDTIHPMQADNDPEHNQVEFYQQMETTP